MYKSGLFFGGGGGKSGLTGWESRLEYAESLKHGLPKASGECQESCAGFHVSFIFMLQDEMSLNVAGSVRVLD